MTTRDKVFVHDDSHVGHVVHGRCTACAAVVSPLTNTQLAHQLDRLAYRIGDYDNLYRKALLAEASKRLRWDDVYDKHNEA